MESHGLFLFIINSYFIGYVALSWMFLTCSFLPCYMRLPRYIVMVKASLSRDYMTLLRDHFRTLT